MALVPSKIPVGTSGEDLDTTKVTTGVGLVHREAVFQADPEDPNGRAAVKNAPPAASDYGGAVRPIGLVGNLAGPAAWQAVPIVAADLIAGTATMVGLHFVNTTAGQLTLTLKDKAGLPLTVLAFDIPAKSVLDLAWLGTVFNGGLNWVASGLGLVGSVVAYQ